MEPPPGAPGTGVPASGFRGADGVGVGAGLGVGRRWADRFRVRVTSSSAVNALETA